MLHYMKTLQEWFSPNVWSTMPVARTAAACLQDFHLSPIILDYKPSHVAVCCLSIAFETYGIQVPLTDDFDENTIWYTVSIINHFLTVRGLVDPITYFPIFHFRSFAKI